MTAKVVYDDCTCDMCKHFELEGIEGVCNYFDEVIEMIPEGCSAFEKRDEE